MAVSRDDVFKAANALLNEADIVPGKITIAQIRERLGGTGSQPTIAKHLRAWKEAQKTESLLPVSVTAAGTDFIEQIWTSAKEEAEKEFHEDRRQMTSQMEEMQSLLDQDESRQNQLEASLKAAHTAADRAQGEADRIADEANRLTADLTDALKSKDGLINRNEALVKQVTSLETQLIEREDAHAKQVSLLERLVRTGGQNVRSTPAKEKSIEESLELRSTGSLEVPKTDISNYPEITKKTVLGLREKAKDVLETIKGRMPDESKEDLKRDGFVMEPIYLLWDRNDEIQKGTISLLTGEGSDCIGNVPIVGIEEQDLISIERTALAALATWLDDAC